jgi:hypothetical protein
MVRRDFVALAAFFVESKPTSLSLLKIVLDTQRSDGTDARESVHHHSNERSVSKSGQALVVKGVEKKTRFLRT